MDNLTGREEILKHEHHLKSYALNFTKDPEDADDLVQETLLKALRYFEKFKHDTNLAGWLFTIMRNSFYNSCRRLAHRKNFHSLEENYNLVYQATEKSNNLGETKIVGEDILSALDKLPPILSETFLMHFEGYKYKEIAEYYDIPEGTVKTRIHDARKRLQKHLLIYKNSIL
ncbi:RNA polymerase sigma factor [Sphingobacterium mizutaii]|uniref:RNA polymerase sigma factor n=1 Tax=Sphingobacterium mizutaii TaxID=1010 RepID=UPI001628225D|nr:RNA polymerase sigma factor [Sphingobacterium mizutaii]